MALTQQEINQINAIITRKGGIADVVDQLRAAQATSKRTSGMATLMPAITCTVSDWAVVRTHVQQVDSDAFMPELMAAIQAALVAGNAAQLGAFFVLLYGAIRYRYAR